MKYPTNSIAFVSVPPVEVREALKRYGFRWNRTARRWQARQSVTTAAVVNHLSAGGSVADLDECVSLVGMEAAAGII